MSKYRPLLAMTAMMACDGWGGGRSRHELLLT